MEEYGRTYHRYKEGSELIHTFGDVWLQMADVGVRAEYIMPNDEVRLLVCTRARRRAD